jgi:hypothetical protein
VTTWHVLVFGDSLTFQGPAGAVPLRDARLWPNLVADLLSGASGGRSRVRVDVVARLGWTARDAWWALTKDPVVATVLAPRADALVLAVGQMDQLPAAVPTYLRDGIPYLRPGALRRQVRRAYRAGAPWVVGATGGRMRQLPQAATDAYLRRVLQAMRLIAAPGAGLPTVLLTPSPWASRAYPSQRTHAPAVAAARRWGAAEAVALVELDPLVGPSLAAGTGNPDGLHWSWPVHQEVAAAVTAALLDAGWGATPPALPLRRGPRAASAYRAALTTSHDVSAATPPE